MILTPLRDPVARASRPGDRAACFELLRAAGANLDEPTSRETLCFTTRLRVQTEPNRGLIEASLLIEAGSQRKRADYGMVAHRSSFAACSECRGRHCSSRQTPRQIWLGRRDGCALSLRLYGSPCTTRAIRFAPPGAWPPS